MEWTGVGFGYLVYSNFIVVLRKIFKNDRLDKAQRNNFK